MFELPVKNVSRAQNAKTVAVLLATFNGLRWLPEQVDSILKQAEVNIRLYISDDLSTDGTWDWLQSLAAKDSRVILLSQAGKFGRAAANFYRLILDADTSECDYVAFADQDDIWEIGKLSRQIRIARQGGFDGVSSNVVAFWPNGKSANIVKSQPQRELDFLFESAGPGCTYLMSPWLIAELRKILVNPVACARDVALHDWLAYAICRASGKHWHIDKVTSVRYRQHESNEFGANHGLSAKMTRLKNLQGGWYRSEILKILNVCMMIKPNDPVFANLYRSLGVSGCLNRMRLLQYINKARRRFIDRAALAVAIALAVF